MRGLIPCVQFDAGQPPRKTIVLTDCIRIEAISADDPTLFAFSITLPARTVMLFAENGHVRQAWVT
jgi:hypothetical protein